MHLLIIPEAIQRILEASLYLVQSLIYTIGYVAVRRRSHHPNILFLASSCVYVLLGTLLIIGLG